METTNFTFAHDPQTLHAIERKAAIMRAQYFAEIRSAAWNRIASVFRTNEVPAGTGA